VAGPMSTDRLCAYIRDRVDAGATALVLHESGDRPLREVPVAAADRIILVIGPEGGLTDAEVDALVAAGAIPVRLGPTVLRTSTAAAVALGALGVLTARWSID
jgi:16S rRNA (uracil1498-N3)-methyltransferase